MNRREVEEGADLDGDGWKMWKRICERRLRDSGRRQSRGMNGRSKLSRSRLSEGRRAKQQLGQLLL